MEKAEDEDEWEGTERTPGGSTTRTPRRVASSAAAAKDRPGQQVICLADGHGTHRTGPPRAGIPASRQRLLRWAVVLMGSVTQREACEGHCGMDRKQTGCRLVKRVTGTRAA